MAITMRRSAGRWTRLSAIGCALAAGLVLALPSGASATSTKCSGFGKGVVVKGIGVSNGQFCSTVNGSGSYVSNVNAAYRFNIVGADWLCNTSIKVDAYDRTGAWRWWRQGAQQSGCFALNYFRSVPTIWLNGSFPEIRGGSIRVTLQSWGQPVTTTWHGIGY